MAEKLALIDKDLLLRLLSRESRGPPAPPPNPVLTHMDRIDQELQSTIDDSKTSGRLKTQKINELLSKHDTFHKQYDNQSGHSNQLGNVSNLGTPPSNDIWRDKTVVAAPPRTKKITEGLLDHIKSSNRMHWDNDGRLVIDGMSIPGTNILDLVHSMTRKRTKATIPVGSDQFLKVLNEINTPRELLPNVDFFKTKPFGVTVHSLAKHSRFKDRPNPVKAKKKNPKRTNRDVFKTPSTSPQMSPSGWQHI